MSSYSLFWKGAVVTTALLSSLVSVVVFPEKGMTLAAMLLLGLPMLWLATYGARRLVHNFNSFDLFGPSIAFPLAYVAWFALASANLFGDPNPPPYRYIVFGLFFYLLGAKLVGKRAASIFPLERFRNDWDPVLFRALLAAMTVLMLASYVYLISQIGIPALSPMAGERRLEVPKHGPTQFFFLCAAYTVFVFLIVHFCTRPTTRRWRWLAVGALGLTALALLSLGSRGLLLTPLLTALITVHYVRRRLKIATVLLAVVLLFAGMSLYGYSRDVSLAKGYVSFGGADDIYGFLYPSFYAYLYVRDSVATFRDVVAVIPNPVPFQHGWLTFGAIAQVLPGHHESSDLFFKRILGNDFIGFGQPATLLGPFYADFGAVGVYAGMFLLGGLVGRLYSWMRSRPTVFRASIYAWVQQTALLSLFGAIFPYFITAWIPLMWGLLSLLIGHRGSGRESWGERSTLATV